MIYFLRADKDGPVKIGWTTDLFKRMPQVRPTPDTELTVIRLVYRDPWVERWFHHQFDYLRIEGEWFQFDPAMLTMEPPAENPGWRRNTDETRYTKRMSLRVPNDLIADIERYRLETGGTMTDAFIRLFRLGLAEYERTGVLPIHQRAKRKAA
jgi:hypothetical protein